MTVARPRRLPHRIRSRPHLGFVVAGLLALPVSVTAADLGDLTIEQLMQVPVTSVSKTESRLFDSPAAITVLTAADIRESGMRTLPDLLRLVPGGQVSQDNAHEWAVGIRGFGGELASKVQVLIDGRTVYSTAVGGVHWDTQDVMVEDIQRIEVIRGPGGTLWGANAVNGVVNVISKNAHDTQGGLASMVYGTEDRPEVAIRQGGLLDAGTAYRVFLKTFDRAGSFNEDGSRADDAWRGFHGGFRVDGDSSSANAFTLQGDYFGGQFHETSLSPSLLPPFQEVDHEIANDESLNLTGRWTHQFANTGELTVQTYFDHAAEAIGAEKEVHDIYDLEVQQQMRWHENHQIVAGFGYRFIRDELTPTPELVITPARRDEQLFNVFFQDAIEVVPRSLTFTLGSKFEHTAFTSFEFEPSARLLWKASERQVVWAAVSRAIRTPTRLERDGRLTTGVEAPGIEQVNVGNSSLVSEELIAYELGYRATPNPRLSFDAAAYFNDYRKLVGYEEGTPFLASEPLPLHWVAPALAQNSGHGQNYGMELSADWQVAPWVRFSGGYSWFQSQLPNDLVDDTSQHGGFARAHVELTPELEWNTALTFTHAATHPDIPAYARWDMGVSWHPRPALELSVVGQNLTAARHRENAHDDNTTWIPRNIYGKITWGF